MYKIKKKNLIWEIPDFIIILSCIIISSLSLMVAVIYQMDPCVEVMSEVCLQCLIISALFLFMSFWLMKNKPLSSMFEEKYDD